MARATRASTAAATPPTTRRQANSKTSSRVKKEATKQEPDVESELAIKQEETTPKKPAATSSRKRTSTATTPSPSKRSSKKAKLEPTSDNDEPKPESAQLPSPSTSSTTTPPPSTPTPKKSNTKKSSPQSLRDRKLKAHTTFGSTNTSPFPTFPHPTPAESKLAHKILSSLHGARNRPETVTAPSSRAGCGDSPSVLDALVRTILSQNTSDANSTRAKRSMDAVYGGSDNWEKIAKGGQGKLQEAIKCGGLSVVKSRVIISILNQVHEKYGTYSLDHLHTADTDTAMRELLSFQGVGPKTASCVALFCLGREDFAVDTHVYRITGLLGWRPQGSSREEAYAHLNARLPGEDKYGLHVLLVGHGKKCDECRAGGKSVGRCELRKAFRRGKLRGEAGEGVKEEEGREVMEEEEEEGED